MKHLLTAVGLSWVLLLAGCGDDTTANNAVPDNYFNKTATLQGTVFDGVTGAKITDANLKVTLVQGTSYRAATVRAGTQDFAGDYSVGSIPLSINNQTQYRLAVTADAYEAFEAAIAFDALGQGSNNFDRDTLDTVYNYVGDVVLYPLGSQANDVTILVTYNGEPVPDAMVSLIRSNLNTIGVVAASGSTNLFNNLANTGSLGPVMATTDATGVATFAGANLVLGGSYSVNVLPVTYDGIALAQSFGTQITIGAASPVCPAPGCNTGSNFTQIVAMSDLVPGTQNGLYVVSASNTDPNNVTSSGELTVVFSRPVSLGNEAAMLASLTNVNVLATTPTALDQTNNPDSTMTASLSADGLTLTLTPNFASGPTAFNGNNAAEADNGLIVSYSNVIVRETSPNDTGIAYNVFTTLVNTTGTNPPNFVLTTPQF
jgi:hypothetical protein